MERQKFEEVFCYTYFYVHFVQNYIQYLPAFISSCCISADYFNKEYVLDHCDTLLLFLIIAVNLHFIDIYFTHTISVNSHLKTFDHFDKSASIS